MVATAVREPENMTLAQQAVQPEPPRIRPRGPSGHAVRRWIPSISLGAILVYLVAIPVVFVAWSSFKPTGLILDEGFTLGHYEELFVGSNIGGLFLNTARFALGTTVVALLIGIPLAWVVERTDIPFRKLFRALIILPMATPPVLLAIGWVTALDPQIGAINVGLMSLFGLQEAPIEIFSMWGMILVEAMVLIPTVFMTLSPAFRNMDPNLEDAAFASGASLFTTMRRIILPMLTPAILSTGVFLFMLSFVVFDVPGTIGVPAGEEVFSTRIVAYAIDSPTGIPEYGRVSALAVVFLVMLFILTFVYNRLTRQSQKFVTISGKGFRAKQFQLGSWKPIAMLAVFAYFAVSVLVPFLMLLWLSLLPFRAGISGDALGQVSMQNYSDLATNPRLLEAASNTILIAIAAGILVTLLSVLTSWVVIRHKAPGAKVLDLLAFSPLALSGVMMGTALIFVYLSFSAVPVYGTIWIIAIAHITMYLSFGSRLTNGVMAQISGELEEAAAASGATKAQALARITIPLMAPALIGLAIWVVAHSIRELSTALMLQGRDNSVLSTLLWSFWEGGRPTQAAAVGIVMMVALALLVAIWQFFSDRTPSSRKGH